VWEFLDRINVLFLCTTENNTHTVLFHGIGQTDGPATPKPHDWLFHSLTVPHHILLKPKQSSRSLQVMHCVARIFIEIFSLLKSRAGSDLNYSFALSEKSLFAHCKSDHHKATAL